MKQVLNFLLYLPEDTPQTLPAWMSETHNSWGQLFSWRATGHLEMNLQKEDKTEKLVHKKN